VRLSELGKDIGKAAFIPKSPGLLAATSLDTTQRHRWNLSVWKVDAVPPERLSSASADGHDSGTSLAVSPDGSLLAWAFWDGRIQVLELKEGRLTPKLVIKGSGFAQWMSFEKGNEKLVCAGPSLPDGRDESFSRWDLATAKLELQWRWKLKEFQVLSTSPIGFVGKGRFLFFDRSQTKIVVLNSNSGKKLYERAFPCPVYNVALAPDRRHLALVNGNGTIYIVRLPLLEIPGKSTPKFDH
jgi:hypothetical protein